MSLVLELTEMPHEIAISGSLETRQASSDAQLLEIWLHGRATHTQTAYRGDIRRFQAAVPLPLNFVTLADLQSYDDSLGHLAAATRVRRLNAVKSLLAFGHRIGYLPYDVGRALRLPPVRNTLNERILTEAAVHRILTLEPNPRNRVIMTLLYATAIRVSELCSLCWRDVQPQKEAAQITVFGKGGKTRSIQFPLAIWQMLCDMPGDESRRDEDPVFRSRTGRKLDPQAVHEIVRKAAKRAGIKQPVSPHWFRHAHASHALDRNAPIHLVQATLGHASITTTGRYLHARPADSSSRYLPIWE
jgi:integrase/recombinase XerD